MSVPVTPLRQRMIEDTTIRNMAVSSQKNYVRAVANFSIFHGCSPDKLSFEDVRDYRLHLITRGLKPNTINPIMGALRFFYGTTLGRKEASAQIPYARREDALPAVLARDEVVRFLKAVSDPMMRTAFITIYAAGLRVSEAVKLTARDIDSARMVIAIRQAKGRKDRYGCRGLQGFLLQAEVIQDHMHETDEPNAVVNFLDSEFLAGQHGRDVDPLRLQNASYSGGDSADIRILIWAMGDYRPVTIMGRIATGVIKNGPGSCAFFATTLNHLGNFDLSDATTYEGVT